MGETFFISSARAMLARAVCEQGRDEKALEITRLAEEVAAPNDIDAQVSWRCTRAEGRSHVGSAELRRVRCYVRLGSRPRSGERKSRVSVLSGTRSRTLRRALRRGLRDLGAIDGRSFSIEYRGAEGKLERVARRARQRRGAKSSNVRFSIKGPMQEVNGTITPGNPQQSRLPAAVRDAASSEARV